MRVAVVIEAFQYHRPESIRAALHLLKDLDGARPYCGGTELIQVAKLGLTDFRHLVDLKGIPDLKKIDWNEHELRVGSCTTHFELESSEVVRQHAPTFADMEHLIGNVRVRCAGSIGGNLAFAEPHSDPAPFLIAWGARVTLRNADGFREIPMDGLIRGPLETAIQADELLVELQLPSLPTACQVVYERIAFSERPAVNVACRLEEDNGVIQNCKVVVGAVSEAPIIVEKAASVVLGVRLEEIDGAIAEMAQVASQSMEPRSDLNGTSEYKRHLVRVLVRRAAAKAARGLKSDE